MFRFFDQIIIVGRPRYRLTKVISRAILAERRRAAESTIKEIRSYYIIRFIVDT